MNMNASWIWMNLNTVSYYNLFSRLEAGVLWGTRILVFSGVLWTKQQGGRDVPCLFQKYPRGRLHRPLQQQEPLLSRITVQRQPKLHHWKHSQTHRQRFVESCTFQFFLFLSLMRFWWSEIDRKQLFWENQAADNLPSVDSIPRESHSETEITSC